MTADRQIDAIDRKLLHELQRDASISHAELAERW
jgi:DNA-binding Lrp family transcriptional regulator